MTFSMLMPLIRVFTKDDCPYCGQAKQLLNNKGFNYEEILIGRDVTREEFLEQFPNVRTVPYIIIGNNHIGGYKQLAEFLGDDV